MSSTASVWSVNGTGVMDGMCTDTWAASPVRPAPPTTSAASRTRRSGEQIGEDDALADGGGSHAGSW